MVSSQNSVLISESMEGWLKESEVDGLEKVEIAEFPFAGRGLRALQHFEAGEKILTIPRSILWTVENAYSDSMLGPILRSMQPSLSIDDILIVFILFVRSRKSGYDGRQSHISALPTSYSSSVFFTEEELEVCAGTSLYTITKQLEQQIKDDYAQLLRQILGLSQDLFPLEKFTIEDYKWALCTVWSRGMDFKLVDGSSIRLLAPFVDMLNHSSNAKQCHVYDTSSGDLSVLAGKDYEVGDQIFIYYGPIPNNRLLRLYGFVIPDNPNDSYDLVVSTHPSAPFFEQKLKLWAIAGLDSVSTISLTLADPLPNSVLRYLRIQRLNQSNLAMMLRQPKDIADKKVSDENEIEILQFLVASIQHHLENFGTQLEELQEQLATGVYSTGSNAWAAAQVSLGEQKILTLAKQSAEGLLAMENEHGV